MKRCTRGLAFLLAAFVLLCVSACAKKKEETTETNAVRTYNFPKTGFGFDLPEGTEPVKGSLISQYDYGPEAMGANMSLANLV